MKKVQCAPVIIPTLNRYEHFKRCVGSLAACTRSNETELIVGLDYPPTEKYQEGYMKIIDYLDSVKSFLKITIIKHQHNLGAIGNIEYLIKYVTDRYDAYIFSEDDNEFSPNFLEYMNNGLEKYKHDMRVYSICGYNYPVNMEEYTKNIFAFHGCSAWGIGRWTHKFPNITLSDIQKMAYNPINILKVLIKAPDIFITLIMMLKRKEFFGDTSHVFYSVINNKVSIFPTISKVRNWGHDGSGIHGEIHGKDIYIDQIIDTDKHIILDDIDIKDMKLHNVQAFLNPSMRWFIGRIKLKLQKWGK